jgi:ribulose-5-phosphate 4-epimerase/fuculose-1-phosphate aldolase
MNDSALLNVDTAVIDDLVDANHILYQQGVVDGFGHVSARNPANPNHFLIARSMAPARRMRRRLISSASFMARSIVRGPMSWRWRTAIRQP